MVSLGATLLLILQVSLVGAITSTASGRNQIMRTEGRSKQSFQPDSGGSTITGKEVPFDKQDLQAYEQQPLMRTEIAVRTGATSVTSALLLALIFPIVTLALGCAAQFLSSQYGKGVKATWRKEDFFAEPEQDGKAGSHLLAQIKMEMPVQTDDATKQSTLTEKDLAGYIQRYFEEDSDATHALSEAV